MRNRIYDIIYDGQGYTGSKYYFQIISRRSGFVWNNTSKKMAQNPSWTDSAITLSETGTTGRYSVILPSDLPLGLYDIVVHKQEGEVPVNTDEIEKQSTLHP